MKFVVLTYIKLTKHPKLDNILTRITFCVFIWIEYIKVFVVIFSKMFWRYCVWTQGLVIAMQVIYHLSYTPSHLCFSYFWDRVFHFCPGPISDLNPPIYAFCIVEFISLHHHVRLTCWDEVLANFLPWLALSWDLPSLYLPSSCIYRHEPSF
jgi:hypothetical protein